MSSSINPQPPRDTLSTENWTDLLDSIKAGRCTPILGAGASCPSLPLAGALARDLAECYGYPLKDTSNLARVTQYLSVRRFTMFPHEKVAQKVASVSLPRFNDLDSPQGIMAALPLPIYITTNYDTFLEEALLARPRKVQRDYCRWNGYDELTDEEPILSTGYQPTAQEPLVYHLHGYHGRPESMVLTEHDYLSFLLEASRQGPRLLPPAILTALAGNALLFVGYSMEDWTFRVLFRGLREIIKRDAGRPALAIQITPDDVRDGREDDAREFVQKSVSEIQRMHIKVYWGTAQEFARELNERWASYAGSGDDD